jgi:hypothetical protein
LKKKQCVAPELWHRKAGLTKSEASHFNITVGQCAKTLKIRAAGQDEG